MKKSSSFWERIFNIRVNPVVGLGAAGFLALSLAGIMTFSYIDAGSAINNNPLLSQLFGIPTVNAEVFLPGLRMPVLPTPPQKEIFVSLKEQTLTYVEGDKVIGQFKISSGVRTKPTPPGEYTVLVKKPVVDYIGPDYNFPRTKWNLMFKTGHPGAPLNYYIHGAYWHKNFGHPMSHGCINVSYANMEGLYNWADVGTKIHIRAQ